MTSEPTLEELKNSELFFTELTDAFDHCENQSLGTRSAIITAKSNQDGRATLAFVTSLSVPKLEQLNKHIENLMYAAKKLDLLPEPFWSYIQYNDYFSSYIPAQIIDWGLDKTKSKKRRYQLSTSFRNSFIEAFGINPTKIDIFTFNACTYKETLETLKDLGKEQIESRAKIKARRYSDVEDISWYRDVSEQCERIVSSYLLIKEYFQKHDIPSFLTNFNRSRF
jgi:hypothetical protein